MTVHVSIDPRPADTTIVAYPHHTYTRADETVTINQVHIEGDSWTLRFDNPADAHEWLRHCTVQVARQVNLRDDATAELARLTQHGVPA